MKRILIIGLLICASSLSLNAQKDLTYIPLVQEAAQSPSVVLFVNTGALSNSFVSLNVVKDFTVDFNLWLDENVTSELNDFIINQVTNFNFQLSYQVKNLNVTFLIERLFEMGSSDFAIEPSLDLDTTLSNLTEFTHVPQSSINLSLCYEF